MAEAGPSSPAPMAPPGFQKASEVLRAQPAASSSAANSSTNAVAGSSMRNASGGLPPIPKPLTAPSSTSASLNATADGSVEANKAAAPEAVTKKPINRPASSKNAIVYNAVQRRNPVLQSIKNVGLEIGDIAADYQVGTHNGVLFLSLKYHRLHPEYIHQRIEKMRNMYRVRILLVLCDVNEHQLSLREISKIAIINNLTVFVAWSNEEVAQYLTTFKAYEHKSDDTLKEPIHQSYMDQFQHVMTSGKKVNKTDSENLAAQFGSFKNISKQSSKVLSSVKGLGATKVTSLIDAFNKPFLVGGLKREPPEEDGGSSYKRMRTDGPGAEEGGVAAVSPEWPQILDDDPEDDEADNADGAGSEGEAEPSRGRERVPSRSPVQSPEAGRNGSGADRNGDEGVGDAPPLAAWRDPLDDQDDDEVDDNNYTVPGAAARILKA